MRESFTKYIFIFIFFSAFIVGYYASDNAHIGMAQLQQDSTYCQKISRPFFKKTCYEGFIAIELKKCHALPHEGIKTDCLNDLESIKSIQFSMISRTLPILLDFTVFTLLALLFTRRLYFSKLDRHLTIPILCSLLEKIRHLCDEDTHFMKRALVCLTLFAIYWYFNTLYWNYL